MTYRSLLPRRHATSRRPLAHAAFAVALLGAAAAAVDARAESLGNGPVLVLGYSGDENVAGVAGDLVFSSVGWRWRRDGADFLDDFFAKGKMDFSWAVEPLVGGVYGDAKEFEASVVPYFQLRPLGWEGVVPYFEGGIGVAYTGLRNYGLGSRVEFSDNLGLGVAFGGKDETRWSLGYRFRHMSHAGIFDDQNEGLNAHFLTLTFEWD